MKITKQDDMLRIELDVPIKTCGTYTYGDGEWEEYAVCVVINEKIQEYGLFYTQYLDYKDSLQATGPIVMFESKQEAERIAEEFGLPVEYTHYF